MLVHPNGGKSKAGTPGVKSHFARCQTAPPGQYRCYTGNWARDDSGPDSARGLDAMSNSHSKLMNILRQAICFSICTDSRRASTSQGSPRSPCDCQYGSVRSIATLRPGSFASWVSLHALRFKVHCELCSRASQTSSSGGRKASSCVYCSWKTIQ